MQQVMIELSMGDAELADMAGIENKLKQQAASFVIDHGYPLIPMKGSDGSANTMIIRGNVSSEEIAKLKSASFVVGVFEDGNIQPF